MNPDNARILRITAAAGTELADAYSYDTVISRLVNLIPLVQKKFTIHRTAFLHAAWLDQSSDHCPIFLTAASRRSLVRVSVPVWGTFLSEPLDIVALVGRYPANKLMSREPIRNRLSPLNKHRCRYSLLRSISRSFLRLSSCYGQVAHALRTLAPVAARSIATSALPLDLHVLSLPLAFILSQDQTLHSIIFSISSSPTPPCFILLSKKFTLALSIVMLQLPRTISHSTLSSIFSINFNTTVSSETGRKDSNPFLFSKIYLKKNQNRLG